MAVEHRKTAMVPIEAIVEGATVINVRGKNLGNIDELANSIREHGLLLPLVVRPVQQDGADHHYELVAGFRRYAAIAKLRESNKSAFSQVPVVRFRGTEEEALLVNLTENIQREDVDQALLAERIRHLANVGMSQRQIATRLGKAQSWVAAMVAFDRDATVPVKTAVSDGAVSPAAGREIAKAPEKEQKKLLKETKKLGGTKAAVSEARGERKAPSKTEIKAYRGDFEGQKGADKVTDAKRLGIVEALSWVLGDSAPPRL